MSSYTESHRRYYLAHREEVRERTRAWCVRNAAAHTEQQRKYREANREARRMGDRIRYWRKKIEENPALAEGVSIPDDLRPMLGLSASVATPNPSQ